MNTLKKNHIWTNHQISKFCYYFTIDQLFYFYNKRNRIGLSLYLIFIFKRWRFVFISVKKLNLSVIEICIFFKHNMILSLTLFYYGCLFLKKLPQCSIKTSINTFFMNYFCFSDIRSSTYLPGIFHRNCTRKYRVSKEWDLGFPFRNLGYLIVHISSFVILFYYSPITIYN